MSFWKSGLLIGGITLGIILFGIVYGTVINTTSVDAKTQILNAMNAVYIAVFIVILLLAIFSLYFIKSDPTMFQPYVLVTLHLALFFSICNLSVSSLQVITV